MRAACQALTMQCRIPLVHDRVGADTYELARLRGRVVDDDGAKGRERAGRRELAQHRDGAAHPERADCWRDWVIGDTRIRSRCVRVCRREEGAEEEKGKEKGKGEVWLEQSQAEEHGGYEVSQDQVKV